MCLSPDACRQRFGRHGHHKPRTRCESRVPQTKAGAVPRRSSPLSASSSGPAALPGTGAPSPGGADYNSHRSAAWRRPRKRKQLPREPTSPSGRSMNGSVADGGRYSEEVICLTRRPSGLGFNIVGGTDQQYIANDNSIYVSRIKKDGAAYLDGRLQEGDKIVAINGKDLKDLRHKDAVELFRNAGCQVSLKIQRRLQPQNGPVGHRGDGESGGLPLAALLVPGLALAAGAVWIWLRYRQRM